MKTNKSIIWLIVVIVLLILSYFIYNYKPIEFNTYEIGNDNIIVNRTDIEYLDTIANVGMDILGIKDHVIIIESNEFLIDLGEDIELLAWVLTKESQSIIYVNGNFNRNKAITTLAHELIHIEQSRTGRFVRYQPPIILWDGEEYNGIEIEYNERPWEIDAFKRGSILADDIRNILVK